MMSERRKRPAIGRHRIVGEVAGYDLPQPSPLLRDRLVHPAPKLRLDVLQLDRLDTFAVFLLTSRSPWLAGRSQAQHMPEPAILLGSHPWPPTLRTSVPDRGQPEALIRRAS